MCALRLWPSRFFQVSPFQLLEYQWSEGEFDKQTSSKPTRRFWQVYDWGNLNGYNTNHLSRAVPVTLSINQSCIDIKIWNIFWKDQPIIECARCWTVVSGGVAKVPLRLIGSLCSSPTSTSPHPQSSSRKQVKLESSWNSFKFSPRVDTASASGREIPEV